MPDEQRTGLPYDPIEEARRQWESHGWEDGSSGMAAVTSVMRAQQIYMARVEAVLRPLGITFARYETMMLLYFSRRGALPMGVIGSRLQVHQTSVTNAVDRLEAAELVKRTPHPSDRRATIVEITEAGRILALKATEALNTEVFSHPGLRQGDMAELIAILARLRREAGDF